eukprot:gene32805-39661_t
MFGFGTLQLYLPFFGKSIDRTSLDQPSDTKSTRTRQQKKRRKKRRKRNCRRPNVVEAEAVPAYESDDDSVSVTHGAEIAFTSTSTALLPLDPVSSMLDRVCASTGMQRAQLEELLEQMWAEGGRCDDEKAVLQWLVDRDASPPAPIVPSPTPTEPRAPPLPAAYERLAALCCQLCSLAPCAVRSLLEEVEGRDALFGALLPLFLAPAAYARELAGQPSGVLRGAVGSVLAQLCRAAEVEDRSATGALLARTLDALLVALHEHLAAHATGEAVEAGVALCRYATRAVLAVVLWRDPSYSDPLSPTALASLRQLDEEPALRGDENLAGLALPPLFELREASLERLLALRGAGPSAARELQEACDLAVRALPPLARGSLMPVLGSLHAGLSAACPVPAAPAAAVPPLVALRTHLRIEAQCAARLSHRIAAARQRKAQLQEELRCFTLVSLQKLAMQTERQLSSLASEQAEDREALAALLVQCLALLRDSGASLRTLGLAEADEVCTQLSEALEEVWGQHGGANAVPLPVHLQNVAQELHSHAAPRPPVPAKPAAPRALPTAPGPLAARNKTKDKGKRPSRKSLATKSPQSKVDTQAAIALLEAQTSRGSGGRGGGGGKATVQGEPQPVTGVPPSTNPVVRPAASHSPAVPSSSAPCTPHPSSSSPAPPARAVAASASDAPDAPLDYAHIHPVPSAGEDARLTYTVNPLRRPPRLAPSAQFTPLLHAIGT